MGFDVVFAILLSRPPVVDDVAKPQSGGLRTVSARRI
jgi:hypothetical protein